MNTRATRATCRPEIKVLDCTLRDGGLINDHLFDDDLVRGVYNACVEAGIDYMEVGYKASKKLFAQGTFGDWKFCDEDSLRRIVGDNPTGLKLACMADAGKCDWRRDILPKSQSVLDLIRVACYVNEVPEAVEMIQDAHEKGYEVSANLMAVSLIAEPDLDRALEALARTPAGTIVVVDSNGALYAEQIEALVKKYQAAVWGTGKEVGIHAHNNMQLGFANTIEAIQHGASRVDATMAGLGRGAGNCPMELLLGYLKDSRFKLRPILKLIEEQFTPLRQKLDWGPSIPYYITGQLNQHPRSAIAARSGPEKDSYVDFYDRAIGDVQG